MNNIKNLEQLSNIAGAKEYPEVWELFSILDSYEITQTKDTISTQKDIIGFLRKDVPQEQSRKGIEIIQDNFPLIDQEGNLIL